MADLATIAKELTLDELHELREEILTLEEALKQVPQEFDFSFQEKIHRVLDITSELEHYTKQLRDTITQSQQTFQQELNNSLIQEQSRHHDKLKAELKNLLYEQSKNQVSRTFIFWCMVFNAVVVGGSLGGIFYVLAFIV